MRHLATAMALGLILLATGAGATSVLDGKEAAEKGDFAAAVAIWRPLAEARDPRAETYIGLMYDNGYGVTQDRAEAFRWFERAAGRGYADAQYHLGFMYHHGRGVRRSQTEALKWYRAAAAQGQPAAQYNLGKMYAHGLVVRRDLVEAYAWLDLAAARRSPMQMLAARDRDIVAARLSEAEIEEARERAQDRRPG